MKDKKILVLYHADCADGFGAAYAAWKKFGQEAEYLPVLYKTDPPPVSDKKVYILDFSYPEEVFEKISREADGLVVIEHHITSEGKLNSANEAVFDTKHSASFLAWKYFHPDKEVPLLLKYIEDKDLWKFILPESREVTRWITTLPIDFEVWDKAVNDFENESLRSNFVKEGKNILEQVTRVINDLISRAKTVNFEGYKSLIIETAVFHSEVGNALVNKMPPIGIVWSEKNGRISVSLRSDGTVDVSKLAQKYGGGGHKAAAGFVLNSRKDLDSILMPIDDSSAT